jgi:hypothetical protein
VFYFLILPERIRWIGKLMLMVNFKLGVVKNYIDA